MKTPEDEAFDDLARRQGMWGGGFPAKRAMSADKLQKPWNEDEWRRNNWRCQHGWLRGEQCEICNAAKPVHCQCFACKDGILHASDCAVHNGPAYPAGPCDCGVEKGQEEDWGALAEKQLASIKRDTQASFEDAMVRATHKVMAEREAQPVQEPVARVRFSGEEIVWLTDEPIESNTLLYTKPPKREWVGLTDEDRKAVLLTAYKEWECEELLLCAREDYLLIEQALKEKNG